MSNTITSSGSSQNAHNIAEPESAENSSVVAIKPQKPQSDAEAAAKTSHAAKQNVSEYKTQQEMRSRDVQKNLQQQVPDADVAALKPGESISAKVTEANSKTDPRVRETTFEFSHSLTQEQAAAIIFQKGQVPAGAKLVQGSGNSWIIQFPNSAEGRSNVTSHYNAHKETDTAKKSADGMFIDHEYTHTWTGGQLHTNSAGPKRRDLKNDYGFSIQKKYRLDEGQVPATNVRRAMKPGYGYEVSFEKPMTKNQVMEKLFQKDKVQQGQVKLIPVPHEPATKWEVQMLDPEVALTKEAATAIGDASAYAKESIAPDIPAGVRAHLENHTVPKNAKRFEPDIYVWEQDGHIVRVNTNGKKGADGYYNYEETKISHDDEMGRKTMRYLMLEKGLPPRQAWQEYIKHWDQIHTAGLSALSNVIGSTPMAPGSGGVPRTNVRERVYTGGPHTEPSPRRPATIVENPPPPPGKTIVENPPSSPKTIVENPPPPPARTQVKPANQQPQPVPKGKDTVESQGSQESQPSTNIQEINDRMKPRNLPNDQKVTIQTSDGPKEMTVGEYRRRVKEAKKWISQNSGTKGADWQKLNQQAAERFGLDKNWQHINNPLIY